MRRSALLLASVLLLAAAVPAAAQGAGEGPGSPRLLVTGWGGFSIREGQRTLRFAEDLVSAGGRITLQRTAAPQPWVQVDRFWRPELRCDPTFVCNEDGIALRGGFLLPLTDETRRGIHPRLLGGLGVAFSEETAFSYLLGVGGAWSLHRRIAPVAEIRWERLPGLRNVVIIAAGLRVGLL